MCEKEENEKNLWHKIYDGLRIQGEPFILSLRENRRQNHFSFKWKPYEDKNNSLRQFVLQRIYIFTVREDNQFCLVQKPMWDSNNKHQRNKHVLTAFLYGDWPCKLEFYWFTDDKNKKQRQHFIFKQQGNKGITNNDQGHCLIKKKGKETNFKIGIYWVKRPGWKVSG